MRNYCTLFDEKYMAQGIALYESLMLYSREDFVLNILAMNDETYAKLIALDLPQVSVIRLGMMEAADGELREARRGRSYQEYCWTLASVFASSCMENGDNITYVDADCIMLACTDAIFNELGNKSIGIVPHRFAERDRARLEKNGKYNVSLVAFAGEIGYQCLSAWAKQCLNWCYYRNEDGKFGDQAYLDKWPSAYYGECYVFENIGIGVAPWNLKNYDVTLGPKVDGEPVVLFHAHEFRARPDGSFLLTNYPLRDADREHVYGPYVNAVKRAARRIA